MAIYLRSSDKLKFVVTIKWLKQCVGDDKRRAGLCLLPFAMYDEFMGLTLNIDCKTVGLTVSFKGPIPHSLQ